MKRPAFQFYPADWRKDVELQSCSMAAQGLWINAMCIAHECEPYGHLTVNGKAMNDAQLGRQVGLSAKEASLLLAELIDAGVARRTDGGVIFSKRMVDDEHARETRAEVGRQNGAKGKEFGAMGAEHGAKGGRPRKVTSPAETPPQVDGQKPPQNPHSSSSSSASTDSVPDGTAADRGSVDAKQAKPAKSPEEMAKSQLWKAAVSLLGEQGLPEPQARSLIGKLNKDYPGGEIVQRAVEATVAAQPADARQYLIATCKTYSGERAGRNANGTLNLHRGFESRNYEDYPDGQPPA